MTHYIDNKNKCFTALDVERKSSVCRICLRFQFADIMEGVAIKEGMASPAIMTINFWSLSFEQIFESLASTDLMLFSPD